MDPVIPTFPSVVYIELIVFFALMAGLLAVSILINAPLEEEANPLQPSNPSKAPWYFLGLQELVSYSAFWGGVMAPALLTLFLLLLPYIDRSSEGIGVWFARARMGMVIFWTVVLVALVVLTVVGVYFRGPNWNFYWPWEGWPGPA